MLFETVAALVPGARAVLRRIADLGGTASYSEIQRYFADHPDTPIPPKTIGGWRGDRAAEDGRQVFFAESASPADTLATLRAARAWAVERNRGNLAAARDYQAGEGPLPERAAQLLLVGRFLTDYYRLVAEWSDWAADLVEHWPDDLRDPDVAAEQFTETIRRAAWSHG